jgi:proton-translocating NADH-quinone oxidoreductase chain N
MDATTALTWLILLPLVASPIIYLAGRLSRQNGGKSSKLAHWMSVLALLVDLYPLYLTWQAISAGTKLTLVVGQIALKFDGISLVMTTVVLGLGLMVAVFSDQYMANEDGEEKYYGLLVAMIGTIIGLCCAADLFNLWVWFEAMAVTSYMLVAFYRQQADALEAGVKYLVQSASGSVLVVTGIALVLSQTGTLDLAAIQAGAATSTNPLVLVAASALFIIGFGVKSALVPLHTWLPDAHSQAPSGISAMLSGIVIEAGLVALLRTVGALSAVSQSWGTIILIFGAINMVLGNLMALRQNQVKRLLAFSSVSHMGYMLVGLGVALIGTGSVEGAAGAFFHLISHSLMKGLAFLAAGVFLYALHIARDDHGPLVIEDLSGAARRYPIAAFAFSVAVFSLGGLPPLAGFMSKWQMFVAGFQTKITWVEVLVIFAALNSVLSLGYYAPLVNRIYRHEPGKLVLEGKPVAWTMYLPLILMALALVVLGFMPQLVNSFTYPAAHSLLAIFGK